MATAQIPETQFQATFKILQTCHIGTIKRRFFNKELYTSKDYGEVDQLRRSVSAMEVIDDEKAAFEKAVAEASPPEEETPEETKARLREQMMNEALIPWEELGKMAKENGVRYVGVKREKVVDGILAATAENTVAEDSQLEEGVPEEKKKSWLRKLS